MAAGRRRAVPAYDCPGRDKPKADDDCHLHGGGLPHKDAMETVLRDALATDTCDPAGVYFGTRSGKVYGSSDNGKSWKVIMEGLPAVVCVKAAWVGDNGTDSPRKHRGAEKKNAGKSMDARSRAVKSRAVGKSKPAKRKMASRARAAR